VFPEFGNDDQEVVKNKKERFFVYEFINGGDMFELIKKFGSPGFGEPIARYFF